MKTTMLYSFLLLLFCSFQLSAQSQNEMHFRVVAESNQDAGLVAVSNQVRSVLPMNIYLPNAFSPNGDGLNDTFGPVAEGIEEMEIVIFNRWGEVVFQSSNSNHRWDGTYKGKKAPLGVYAYNLVAKNADNESIVKKGSVTVVY